MSVALESDGDIHALHDVAEISREAELAQGVLYGQFGSKDARAKEAPRVLTIGH